MSCSQRKCSDFFTRLCGCHCIFLLMATAPPPFLLSFSLCCTGSSRGECAVLSWTCCRTDARIRKDSWKERNIEVRVHASAGPAVRAESAVSVSFGQVCSFLMGFGLHVTGNVNKTPVADAEVAAQSERKAQQEYFAYVDLRSGKLWQQGKRAAFIAFFC